MSSVFSRKITMSTFSGCLTGDGTPLYQRTGRRQTKRSSIWRKATFNERMPPPTGVVSGPLMPTRYVRKASTVSSGSQLSNSFLLFSPAWTSIQAIFLRPPYAFSTAASKTRCEARQMSGPVPSPSMNGRIGWSGTLRRPPDRVIAFPFLRTCGAGLAMSLAPLRGAEHSASGCLRTAEAACAEPSVRGHCVKLRNPLPRAKRVTMLGHPRRAAEMQLEFQCQKCEESFSMDVSDVQSDPVLRCPGCGTRAPDEQVEAVVAGLEELFAALAPLRRKFSTSVDVNSEDMPPPYDEEPAVVRKTALLDEEDSEDDDAEEVDEEVAELE